MKCNYMFAHQWQSYTLVKWWESLHVYAYVLCDCVCMLHTVYMHVGTEAAGLFYI